MKTLFTRELTIIFCISARSHCQKRGNVLHVQRRKQVQDTSIQYNAINEYRTRCTHTAD